MPARLSDQHILRHTSRLKIRDRDRICAYCIEEFKRRIWKGDPKTQQLQISIWPKASQSHLSPRQQTLLALQIPESQLVTLPKTLASPPIRQTLRRSSNLVRHHFDLPRFHLSV